MSTMADVFGGDSDTDDQTQSTDATKGIEHTIIENVNATVILPNAKVYRPQTGASNAYITKEMIQAHLPARNVKTGNKIETTQDVITAMQQPSDAVIQLTPDNAAQTTLLIENIELAATNPFECSFSDLKKISSSYIAVPSVYQQLDFLLCTQSKKNTTPGKAKAQAKARIAGICLLNETDKNILWNSGAKIQTTMKEMKKLNFNEIYFDLNTGGVRPLCDNTPCLAWHETKKRTRYIFVVVKFSKKTNLINKQKTDPVLLGFDNYTYKSRWLSKVHNNSIVETSEKGEVHAYFALFENESADSSNEENRSQKVQIQFSDNSTHTCTVFNVSKKYENLSDYVNINKSQAAGQSEKKVLTLTANPPNIKYTIVPQTNKNCTAMFLPQDFHQADLFLPISMSGQLPLTTNLEQYDWIQHCTKTYFINEDDTREKAINRQFCRITNDDNVLKKDTLTYKIYCLLFPTNNINLKILNNVAKFDIQQLLHISNSARKQELHDALFDITEDTQFEVCRNLKDFVTILKKSYYLPQVTTKQGKEVNKHVFIRTLCCMLAIEWQDKHNDENLLECLQHYNLDLSGYVSKKGETITFKDTSCLQLAKTSKTAFFTKHFLQFCAVKKKQKIRTETLKQIDEEYQKLQLSPKVKFENTTNILSNTIELYSADVADEAVQPAATQAANETAAHAAAAAASAAREAKEIADKALQQAVTQAAKVAASAAAHAALKAVEKANEAVMQAATENATSAAAAAAVAARKAIEQADEALQQAGKTAGQVAARRAANAAANAAKEAAERADVAQRIVSETPDDTVELSHSKLPIYWDKRVDELRKYFVVMGIQSLNAQSNG